MHMYHCRVLEVRNPKEVTELKSSVRRAKLLLEALEGGMFPCIFLLPYVAHIPWLTDTFHLQSQQWWVES